MPKTKMSYRDWSDQVLSMTKTRQDKDVNDRIGLAYAKIEIKLLRSI